ncbi:MAG: poly-beta-hydroxybutyrate polymerase [Anaerolinea sp.]|nr:poly-beta-hydroxybutyrate polymerase [Anaerolinea sp.]
MLSPNAALTSAPYPRLALLTSRRGGPVTQAPASDPTIEERVRLEIERTIQRSIKGLEYVASGDPAVGLTPKDVIYSRGTLKLYHYRPMADEVYRVPVLLVMSLVSKPYILDLTPGQSLVEFLLKRGFDVFMIDWGAPRTEDKRLRLEDYVLDFIPDCIARVRETSGEPDVSVVGYCMGGILASMYASLHPDGPTKNLVCFTTPVNMDGMTLMRQWCDRRYFDVDRIVDTLGNVPPELLSASFDMLRPISQAVGRIRLWDNMWNDEFVKSHRMFDRWANDQIPFPGECFRQTTRELMWENKLYKGRFELAGRRVDLGTIRVPFLHVMAEHDHIVPYEAARVLVPMVGSEDKRELVIKGGHVSLVAGGNAIYRLWPQLDSWLAERSV